MKIDWLPINMLAFISLFFLLLLLLFSRRLRSVICSDSNINRKKVQPLNKNTNIIATTTSTSTSRTSNTNNINTVYYANEKKTFSQKKLSTLFIWLIARGRKSLWRSFDVDKINITLCVWVWVRVCIGKMPKLLFIDYLKLSFSKIYIYKWNEWHFVIRLVFFAFFFSLHSLFLCSFFFLLRCFVDLSDVADLGWFQ